MTADASRLLRDTWTISRREARPWQSPKPALVIVTPPFPVMTR